MKANANKRKIFDAVDLLTEDTSAQTTDVKAENRSKLFIDSGFRICTITFKSVGN